VESLLDSRILIVGDKPFIAEPSYGVHVRQPNNGKKSLPDRPNPLVSSFHFDVLSKKSALTSFLNTSAHAVEVIIDKAGGGNDYVERDSILYKTTVSWVSRRGRAQSQILW